MKKQTLLITIIGLSLIINGCGKKEEQASKNKKRFPLNKQPTKPLK